MHKILLEIIEEKKKEVAGLKQNGIIKADGIPGLRIGQYLDSLVASLSAGAMDKVGYTVHHGVITIATTTVIRISDCTKDLE